MTLGPLAQKALFQPGSIRTGRIPASAPAPLLSGCRATARLSPRGFRKWGSDGASDENQCLFPLHMTCSPSPFRKLTLHPGAKPSAPCKYGVPAPHHKLLTVPISYEFADPEEASMVRILLMGQTTRADSRLHLQSPAAMGPGPGLWRSGRHQLPGLSTLNGGRRKGCGPFAQAMTACALPAGRKA